LNSLPDSIYYLRLAVNIGTKISFYQANLTFFNGAYMIHIDKYDTGTLTDYNTILDFSNINYNSLLTNPGVKELVFPIYSHSYKVLNINDDKIIDSSGNITLYTNILSKINITDVVNAGNWVKDTGFESQYLGITLASITGEGLKNIRELFTYNFTKYVSSKTLYIYLPDMVKIKNILGNTIYRITYNGNVHAPRITTANLTLFTPFPSTSNSTIPGAGEIISIYAQNSLLSDQPAIYDVSNINI
jgi:hypothetical protein